MVGDHRFFYFSNWISSCFVGLSHLGANKRVVLLVFTAYVVLGFYF